MTDATLPSARTLRHLFRGQPLHAASLAVLFVVAHALAAPLWRAPDAGSWLGVDARVWFRITIATVVAHQAIVWLVFRLQLGWGTMTRLFGGADLAVWGAIFMPFLLARPLLIIATGLADGATLALPRWLSAGVGVVLLAPALYAGYSVRRYFGMPRALGGDHFRVAYREMPLVREGAFRWTPNAMYGLVGLGLWSIALLLDSPAALVAALWQHAAIWAHYRGTERPDMELMYGADGPDAAATRRPCPE